MKHEEFRGKRRQKFLTFEFYALNKIELASAVNEFRDGISNSISEGDLKPVGQGGIFDTRLFMLKMAYTAGTDIESLHALYADVVNATEEWTVAQRAYVRALGEASGTEMIENDSVFTFESRFEFQQALDVASLGILLGDGENLRRFIGLLDRYRGTDLLFESIIEPAVEDPRDNNDFFHEEYDPLLDAFCTAESDEEASAKVQEYLQNWYKSWEGATWHNGHLRGIEGDYMPYYGYWSFEAAAISVIYGIDDSSFRDQIVYPKDLADWARANHSLDRVAPGAQSSATGYRCEAGQPCPRSGYWSAPAQSGSRQYFKQGTVMPTISSDYGVAIWQWDRDQTDPLL